MVVDDDVAWSYSMDAPFGVELAANCKLCVACPAAYVVRALEHRQLLPSLAQLITTGRCNCSINPPAAEATLIGGVDDGVALEVDD